MAQKLYFFTFSYPFGKGENWKAQELEHFVTLFDKITVVPFTFGGNVDKPRLLPEGVQLVQPLFEDLSYKITSKFLLSLLNKNVFYYLNEFFRERVYSKKAWLINWINTTAFCQRLQEHDSIKQIISESDLDTTFYFFWGIYHTSIVPLLPKSSVGKIVVRFHGGDLYKERNNGYIPYRCQLLSEIEIAAPISELGAKYLSDQYPDTSFTSQVARIGVESKGQSLPSQDGVLRILSCANLIPLKRIGLIAGSLAHLSFNVEWTHIGDGELMEEIEQEVKTLPPNVNVILKGWLQPQEVQQYYADNVFDLFVNASSTEGVPVAVMEAMAAGIPVLATDVGGTAELVDESVGKLLEPDPTAGSLAKAIEKYYLKSEEEKTQTRENAFDRYKQMADARVLANGMYKLLSD